MNCFNLIRRVTILIAISACATLCAAPPPSREAVLAELRPFAGTSVRSVDVSTLLGKTMCGYQGWFNAEGDGMDRGYRHWLKGRGAFAPGNAKFDMWPDVSDLPAEERFATEFRHADGRVAEVFSSAKRGTVLRHFEWMREYGIDGAFVQRFITDLRDPRALRHNNTVLAHCREGANANGRAYALMYDLSGLGAGRIGEVLEDFRELRARMRLPEDSAYLHHRGKPLVAVWGVGFNDNRKYTLAETRTLVEGLQREGCAIMLGVPTGWREGKGDAIADLGLPELLAKVDVVSPWTVGRYGTPAEAARHGERKWKPDIAWCAERGVDYLPVVFPGFSWRNMHGGALDQIPRRKGEFLWSQFQAAKRAGAGMAYVAMFDEVDEATAIFKCTNDVPKSDGSQFVTYEGQPSDRYLRLTGAGAKLIRGEIPADAPPPE